MLTGSDYEALIALPLTFTPNTKAVDVPVTIIDDNIFEPTERFTASLSLSMQVAGVSVAPAMAEVSILDEDGKPWMQILSSIFMHTRKRLGSTYI